MTISYWLDGKNKHSDEVDVAIIGGGIMGACVAYWLSRRAAIKSVVVEQRRRAFGASGRNAGFVLRGIVAYYNQAAQLYGRQAARSIYQRNEETLAHLQEFAGRRGAAFGYERCGSYLLACSLEELHHLEESAQMMAEDGFAVQYLKQDPLKRDYYGALFNECDAGVHAAGLVDALLEESGIRVLEGEQVFRIETLSDGRIELHTDNRCLRASRVLLLTNAYAGLIDQWFVDKLQPVRGQCLVTKPLKKRLLDKLCYANFGYEYFRQLPDGRLLLGGGREPYIPEEAGTYTDAVTPAVQTGLSNYLRDRFPEAAGVGIDYRWSGLMAFTRDGLPIVGEMIHQPIEIGRPARSLPGVFFALGCNGHGMGWSFSLAKLLVEVALDGADPGTFDVARLNKNRTIATLR